jgi:UDP-N-acetylmuramyl pentapeptide phosphotransferase/UDP-N-acetylglucosamine-1-phosphate transferase
MPSITGFLFFLPLLSFMAVVGLAVPARRLARWIGMIDKPDKRKTHKKPVPPIGGLIIFPVFIGVSLLAGRMRGSIGLYMRRLPYC